MDGKKMVTVKEYVEGDVGEMKEFMLTGIIKPRYSTLYV